MVIILLNFVARSTKSVIDFFHIDRIEKLSVWEIKILLTIFPDQNVGFSSTLCDL